MILLATAHDCDCLINRTSSTRAAIRFSLCKFKALAKRTCKSTQVNASLQWNQKLHTDLRMVAKRIHKSACKWQKAVNFTWSTCVDLRWPVKLASKFELDQSPRKSTQVDASQRKWVAKRNASWRQVQNLSRLASEPDIREAPVHVSDIWRDVRAILFPLRLVCTSRASRPRARASRFNTLRLTAWGL